MIKDFIVNNNHFILNNIDTISFEDTEKVLLDSAFETIKLNYKCKAGTVDDSNKCEPEQNTTSLTDRYDDKNTSSNVIAGYVRNDNKLVNSILSGDYDLSEKDKNYGLEKIRLLDNIFKDKLLPEKEITYRGISKSNIKNLPDNWNKIGNAISPGTFLSTSRSRSEAEGFITGGPNDDSILIKLILPKNTNAINVSDFVPKTSAYAYSFDENEVLVDRNTEFKVVDYRIENSRNMGKLHIATWEAIPDEQKQNSAYLADAFEAIKLNYKCKTGTVDDSNKCNSSQTDTTNIDTTKNKKIASFISNALQEDPRRMFHGYIPKKGKLLTTNDTGFWLDSEGKSYVHKKLVDIPEDKRNDLINVHSHAGQDREQLIVNKKDVADFEGIESFSGGDFQMLQFNIKNGYGRKIAVIVAPDEYDYFEVPEEKLGEFIKIKDIANKFEAHSSSLEESRKFLMEISNKNGFIYRPAIKFEQKQNSSYLADAFETIKLNYNCPDSEKNGTGPGSCGGNKSDTKKEILEGQENKQEATLTNLPLGKPDFSGVSIQISKDVGLTNEKYRQEIGDNVVGALDAYRRTDYIGINSYLRNGNTKGQDINSIKDQIKLLDSAFIKKTSEPITTFRVLRGQDIINKYQPGSKIDEKAYVSTTISGGVGFFGADSENAISLQIEVPKGTPFVDMSKATTGVENELLLPRNGKLLVKEVRDVTKKLYNLDENGNMVPKDVTRKYARVEYIPENDNNVNSSFQEISSTFNSELGGFHITEYKAPDAKPLRIMSQDKADNAKLLEAIQDLPPETLPAQFTVMKMPNNVPAKYYAKLDTIGVSKKLSSAEMTKAIKDVMTTIKRNERLNEVALLQDAYNTIKLNTEFDDVLPERFFPGSIIITKKAKKQNSTYLDDVTNFIKLNYKCKAGTVDDSNKCELENSDVPETRTFHEENIKSKILSLNDSKYPKDAVFRSKSRSNMTKNVELDILNNDNHVKILSDNIDRLHYQCDNLKIPRLRGIVADKNTKAGLASMADGILAVTPDMFRNDPDSEVDLRLSRNQERLNYINNKINSLESLIQSDKEKWTKNNPSLVNSGMKFEESTFYKTGYSWSKEINEYKSEKNNIMARINDLNTKKTNALIYTWKPGMPDSEKPFGASEYFPFEQSPKLLLDHEFGHHIHQLYGVKNAKSYAEPPLEKKIDQIYKKSEKDGTLIVPSKYAASDHQEWFAESYSLYVNGRDDLVTPGLIDLFKKIGVKHDN